MRLDRTRTAELAFGFTSMVNSWGHVGTVSYPIHTVPGQASPEAGHLYLVHILSPLTDNCSSCISGRGRMAVEIIS